MPHEIARADEELAAMDVSAEKLLEGNPQPRAKVMLLATGDYSGGMSGLFEAQPGRLRNVQEGPETYYILKARAKIEDPTTGESLVVTAGDVLVLSAGAWE
jgi:uncharacterized cupin superfamily protein